MLNLGVGREVHRKVGPSYKDELPHPPAEGADLPVADGDALQRLGDLDGQKVVVDTRNGTVNGIVSRVDPGVTDGTVVVDVDLQGALPAGARPQMQVEGIVYISQLPNTLYVGKPSYVKNDAAIAAISKNFSFRSSNRYAPQS